MGSTHATAEKQEEKTRGVKVVKPGVAAPKGFVLVPKKRFDQLLEDLHDLAVIAERRDEGLVSWEDVKKRLKKDGLL